ncbi:MAG: hypothetical protein HC837_10720 [Chloroflexaceae bacterium]|nr:hypothetical protein [Chloroflexaceae bacterium]
MATPQISLAQGSLDPSRSVQPSSDAPDIRSHKDEAIHLYQRGVAAARGGQRRIAAGLLTRSVQLDPYNESAWLWLSGVLDDPHQIAFCLHSVLKLNPTHERARQGLIWLEERQLLQGSPKPAPLLDIEIDAAPAKQKQRKTRQTGDAWWANWRQGRRDNSKLRLLLWTVPVVLLFLSLVIHQAFTLAAAQQQTHVAQYQNQQAMEMATMVALSQPVPTVAVPEIEQAPTVGAAVMAHLDTYPAALRESQIVQYLSAMTPLRQQLREATETYRTATGKPGSALTHVAAARQLRTDIEQVYVTMQSMTPPESLSVAYQDYLTGLELEMAALDDLLDYYTNFTVEAANRAAVRLQEASNYIQQANASFGQRLQQIEQNSVMSVHTPR